MNEKFSTSLRTTFQGTLKVTSCRACIFEQFDVLYPFLFRLLEISCVCRTEWFLPILIF